MQPFKLSKIKNQKKVYLVELKNAQGEVHDKWLDEKTILFMDSSFFDRVEAEPSLISEPVENFEKPEEDQNSKNQVANSMECDICRVEFTRKDHLKDHIQKQHLNKKEKLRCPICSSIFGYKSNWTQHMGRKHKWTPQKAKKHFDENLVNDVATEENECQMNNTSMQRKRKRSASIKEPEGKMAKTSRRNLRSSKHGDSNNKQSVSMSTPKFKLPRLSYSDIESAKNNSGRKRVDVIMESGENSEEQNNQPRDETELIIENSDGIIQF